MHVTRRSLLAIAGAVAAAPVHAADKTHITLWHAMGARLALRSPS